MTVFGQLPCRDREAYSSEQSIQQEGDRQCPLAPHAASSVGHHHGSADPKQAMLGGHTAPPHLEGPDADGAAKALALVVHKGVVGEEGAVFSGARVLVAKIMEDRASKRAVHGDVVVRKGRLRRECGILDQRACPRSKLDHCGVHDMTSELCRYAPGPVAVALLLARCTYITGMQLRARGSIQHPESVCYICAPW